MTAPDTLGAPQVDQVLRPAGIRLAHALDVTQRGRVGPGVEIGEGGVITQTHPQRQLDGFHGDSDDS
ncbi:hypothetical protein D3C81_2049850 [compost metagenome]